jgi:hypothetical protein
VIIKRNLSREYNKWGLILQAETDLEEKVVSKLYRQIISHLSKLQISEGDGQ